MGEYLAMANTGSILIHVVPQSMGTRLRPQGKDKAGRIGKGTFADWGRARQYQGIQ